MIGRHRFILALAIPLLAVPGAAHAVDFLVLDQMASEELSETTRLYVDGTLVATIHLDDHTASARVPVSVPEQPGHAHDYALCGDIAIRRPDGGREIHQVSGQGTLLNPSGRSLVALGARDFTLFYLADPNDARAVAVRPGRAPFCQAPVS